MAEGPRVALCHLKILSTLVYVTADHNCRAIVTPFCKRDSEVLHIATMKRTQLGTPGQVFDC